jgi:formylglycine-generating enzyme
VLQSTYLGRNEGIFFSKSRREGSHGNIGQEPTEAKKLEPVTTVTWCDAIVWTNALSEMIGLSPVYREIGGTIIRDSRNANDKVLNNAVQTNNQGYRLPKIAEWEMAARWRKHGGDGSIFVKERYWTPGSYASGATGPTWNPIDEAATRAVAWCSVDSSQDTTQPVGQLCPNHLNIYDMSGNVMEWCSDLDSSCSDLYRGLQGGCYDVYGDIAYHLQVGYVFYGSQDFTCSGDGFRIVFG